MAKIRSKDQVCESIDNNFNSRRSEIRDMISIVRRYEKKSSKIVLCKSLILISYSNWEGFVKETTKKYLGYVKNLNLRKNKINFLLISSLLCNVQQNNIAIMNRISETNRIFTDPNYKFHIDEDILTDTKSNLNSKMLMQILSNIGLNTDIFDLKYKYIDHVILANRNGLAHGEQYYEDDKLSIDIADNIIELMEMYKNLIENSLVSEKYLRS